MSRGMSPVNKRAVTLMELVISLALLSLIVLTISNIESFSKYIFIGADRKAKAINEANYVIAHMSKFVGQAVGDANNTPISFGMVSNCLVAVRVWVDDPGNLNGIRDDGDRQILYCFNKLPNTGPSNLDVDGDGGFDSDDITYLFDNLETLPLAQVDFNNNGEADFNDVMTLNAALTGQLGMNLTYYSNWTQADPGASEKLSNNIWFFNASVDKSSIAVNLTTCWNASISSGSQACGSIDNPRFTIKTSIFMPSVTANSTP